MFDQKEIKAYRAISAPADLRDKVLSSCAEQAPRKGDSRVFMKWASSIAACFVLVMVLTVFAAGEYGVVSVAFPDGELIKEQSVVYVPDGGAQPVSLYRELAETVIPFSLDGHAEISVSDGIMNIIEPDTDKILYTGTEYSMDGKTLVHWTVCADDTARVYEMTVRGIFDTEKIILSYNESDHVWTVTRVDAE
jgi:hypothetical protein